VSCFDVPFLNEYRLSNRLKRFVPKRFRTAAKQLKEDIDNRRVSYTTKALEFNFRLNFLRRQFKVVNHRISPSQYLIGKYEREGFNDISYLPLGVPRIPHAESAPSDLLRIGYIGNINHPKGLAVVTRELFSFLADKKAALHIYGQPYDLKYYNKVKDDVAGMQTNMVAFHGGYANNPEELKKIFAAFDVLIFPSLWEENAPLVVREALLAGKPVIASRLGGVPEIVADGMNGLLFDPFKEGDLQAKVKMVLTDPELLQKLIRGARKTKIDTMEEHIEKIISLYEKTLNRC
jgi:glycosyltransferase involved in cell wall biosynthesis